VLENQIIQGDALKILKSLDSKLVDCVVSSPPYWGLRDYGVNGQLGLESTLDEYIQKMTGIFREARRVLKDEGTLWLNMGDAYAGSHTTYEGNQAKWQHGKYPGRQEVGRCLGEHLKPKDLIGQPWRLAFALQADGWYLRSDIIWAKPNPMPESVTDRPTKSHEYIFLMSKQARYFYDADAVREEGVPGRDGDNRGNGKIYDNRKTVEAGWSQYYQANPAGRKKRTVWTVATQPFPEAHFATFPEKLIEPCIRAGTSEKGYCAECGKPWARVVEKEKPPDGAFNKARFVEDENIKISPIHRSGKASGQKMQNWLNEHPPQTLGWQPSCSCDADTVPGLILDPFMGSGTVALVAKKLCRNYLGIELNPEYVEMAEKRLRDKMGLFKV